EIKHSESMKAKRMKTTAQLPAFRDSSNFIYMTTVMTDKCPRKLIKFADEFIKTACEISKSIALANETRGTDRAMYISNAIALLYVSKSYIVILNKRGIVSKDDKNKTAKEADKLLAQLIAWRDFTSRQG
ncbi:MAG: hypothetical protein ACI30I_05045, partial [Parabacteroides sp.]